MLIRSQDKKEIIVLESVVGLSIEFFGGEPHIVANPKNGGMKKFGIYSSEEKAIKVLDMIQNAYVGCLWTDSHYDMAAQANVSDIVANNVVFEMPQDLEV